LPAGSAANPPIVFSAFVAGPPSPEEPDYPVPATVVMMPAGEMRRTVEVATT